MTSQTRYTLTLSNRRGRAQVAVCVRNKGYEASLERNKIYAILRNDEAERDGDLRVVDESGEDYLFSADRFVAIEVPSAVRASLLRRPGPEFLFKNCKPTAADRVNGSNRDDETKADPDFPGSALIGVHCRLLEGRAPSGDLNRASETSTNSPG